LAIAIWDYWCSFFTSSRRYFSGHGAFLVDEVGCKPIS